MLHYLTFKSDYRNTFTKGDHFKFVSDVNLLVGEQGSGKSSLLDLIRENSSVVQMKYDPGPFFSFDFEKGNPRIQNEFKKTANFTGQVMARFVSHGQTVNALLEKVEEEKDCLFLLDEPDTALSIRSCHKLIDKLKNAEKNGCQVIAAVHNPIIISAFENVLSLEHKRWMDSKDFIEIHEGKYEV